MVVAVTASSMWELGLDLTAPAQDNNVILPDESTRQDDPPLHTTPGGSQAGLPAFPGDGYDGEFSLVHTTSATQETVDGNGFMPGLESGDNNGPGSLPDSYVIAPGDNDDLAYAVYGISGLDADRPVGMLIEVQSIPLLPGDDDPLSLHYWLGLANYTNYKWEWLGPFSEPQDLVLNSAQVRDRYVNAGGSGKMYFAIVAMADEEFVTGDNPLGLVGVQVNASVISSLAASDDEYFFTSPHFTPIANIEFGDKVPSGLDETQYVTISWEHISDPVNDNRNEAFFYQIWRQEASTPGKVLLKLQGAASGTRYFVDPRTSDYFGDPIPGATYIYYLRAYNHQGGFTRFSAWEGTQIPFYPPTGLSATDGDYSDRVKLIWQAAEGATSYEVYRDNQDERLATITDVEATPDSPAGPDDRVWDDESVPDFEVHTYWLKAVNQYSSSGFSLPDDGYITTGPLAGLSILPGQESGTAPHLVNFDASSSFDPDGGDIVGFDWDWEGDGTFDELDANAIISHTYEQSGSYNPTVEVTDDEGVKAQANVVVEVNTAPVAELTADPTAGEPPLTVNFDATGSTDSDGTIVKYDYDWDSDGDYDLLDGGATPSNEYTASGDYTATVRVTDDDGATGTATVQISVNAPPVADLQASPTAGEPPLTVNFDATGSTDSDGTIAKYDYDWDSDGDYDLLDGGATPSNEYTASGDYTATVRVTDDDGGQATAQSGLIVVNIPPTADLTADPTSGSAPLTVTFDATGSADSDGTIVLYEYDFDEGAGWEDYGTDSTPEHEYTEAGTYTAQVRITDDDGGTDTANVEITAEGQGDWWMFGRDAKHASLSPYNGPATNALDWSYTTESYIHSSPVIAADGTIYVGNWQGSNLYAINADGSLKWKYTVGDDIVSSQAIAIDGTVYASSVDGKLYAINPDGTFKWDYLTGDMLNTSPAIGADGTIYVGSYDHKLYAINPDGSLKWAFTTGGALQLSCSPAIGADGTVYVGSADDKLYAINPDGSENWTYTVGAPINCSPTIGTDGTVYVGCDDSNVYAINADGSLQWIYSCGGIVHSSPAISEDGIIYVGSKDAKLYALNPNGSLRWTYTTGSEVDSSPTVGADGTVYVGSLDNKLYAINPDGSLKWLYTTGNYVYSSPAIGSDGTLYVGSYDGNLYAFGPGNGPVAVLTADPTDGNPPLTVNFDASESFDVDGTIDDYEWDFDGNGEFNEAGAENDNRGVSQPTGITYNSSGTYNATVRVTDNDSKTDTASIEITVS